MILVPKRAYLVDGMAKVRRSIRMRGEANNLSIKVMKSKEYL